MNWFRIVNTDNFGSDYPDEKFVEHLPVFYRKEDAESVCAAINATLFDTSPRYFKVVNGDYKLEPGFEP